MKNWEDVYELPLKDGYMNDNFRSGRIRDNKGNFVFQFIIQDYQLQEKVLDILNGKTVSNVDNTITNDKGIISVNGEDYIMIRGWGNLTGIGAMHLPIKDALNIQDTFAEWIVMMLGNSDIISFERAKYIKHEALPVEYKRSNFKPRVLLISNGIPQLDLIEKIQKILTDKNIEVIAITNDIHITPEVMLNKISNEDLLRITANVKLITDLDKKCD